MSNIDIPGDDFDDFDSYDEEDLLGEDSGDLAEPVTQDAPRFSFLENRPLNFTSSAPEMCVVSTSS